MSIAAVNAFNSLVCAIAGHGRRPGVDEDDLRDVLREIRALGPKPRNQFHSGAGRHHPDVLIKPSPDGRWQIEFNPETLPGPLINQTYFLEVSRLTANYATHKAFLNECFNNANWLIRSLDQRAKTILKVAAEIVRQQDAFLEHGVAHCSHSISEPSPRRSTCMRRP